MTTPRNGFESLLDEERAETIDEGGRRQLELMLRNDAEARLERRMLEEFDSERSDYDPGVGQVDRWVEGALAALDEALPPRATEPEPEIAELDQSGVSPREESGRVRIGHLVGRGDPEPEVAYDPEPEIAADSVTDFDARDDLAERRRKRAERATRRRRRRSSPGRESMPGSQSSSGQSSSGQSSSGLAAAISTTSLRAAKSGFSFAQSTTRKFAVAVGAVPSRARMLVAAVVLVSFAGLGGWTLRGRLLEPTPPVASLAVEDAEPVEAPDDVAAAAEAEEHRRHSKRNTPGALLSRAERARAEARHVRAAGLYRRLLRRHARSPEAEVARLGLARVLLDDLEEPEEALVEFENYRADHPEGVLVQDADLGRAQALQEVGQPEERRAAWQQVADDHAGTPAGELARRRLAGTSR